MYRRRRTHTQQPNVEYKMRARVYLCTFVCKYLLASRTVWEEIQIKI